MNRSFISLLALAALAGCGQGAQQAGDQTTNAAPAQASGGAAAVPCQALPPHAVLAADAAITLCTQGQTRPGHQSGTVAYTTAQPATALLGWYRDQANTAGLKDGLSTPTSYSATQGTQRSLMVMVAPQPDGAGTSVTLNWGMDK